MLQQQVEANKNNEIIKQQGLDGRNTQDNKTIIVKEEMKKDPNAKQNAV